jgi:NAD(P)-dependent dehydrogenase (short-subunit alcohol dehydrogenase family)
MLTVQLAYELRGPSIKVNSVHPGTSSVGHFRENPATLQLPAEVVAELDRIGGDSKP